MNGRPPVAANVGWEQRVHGGVKFYRGNPKAARAYLERDHSLADDYYLAEGTGLAERLIATPDGVEQAAAMDADTYEAWVAGIDVDTGLRKGRLRTDPQASRFVEVIVNGPKTWSLAAALHPEISTALDQAQDEAAAEITGWVAQHATTRIGPRDRQVQVPVEEIEAAVIRHYTSRAGDPHRHLHLQINARVRAASGWRGLHTVGFRESIEAINGIGHAAVATNPKFRTVLAAHGFTLDPATGEITQLAPYVGGFSARTNQINQNIDRYEATWRQEHPGEEPGPKLREIWDRRAWAQARPDKVIPQDGRELIDRWNHELVDLGYRNPTTGPVAVNVVLPGWINRDAAANLAVSQLGAKHSAWNAADLRGRVENILAGTGLVCQRGVRAELAEDITTRAIALCVPLLTRSDVPEHVRALTSTRVLEVEADIIGRIAARSTRPTTPAFATTMGPRLSPAQTIATEALAGNNPLVVIEGAAGAGKTATLRRVHQFLQTRGRRLMVVTPTLKAAHVAATETGAEGHSAAWLIHQHGWQCDSHGQWTRTTDPISAPEARLRRGDLLLVDEAGMLDQDTAHALLVIADETGARIGFIGDRHQLPAIGRGGVLDHAIAYAHPTAVIPLTKVHRFTDPHYAALTLKMRTGDNPGDVFDHLIVRGQIVIHPTDIERTAALANIGAAGELVIADTREQVTALNAAIRHQHQGPDQVGDWVLTTAGGEQIGLGDRVATRRNNPDLGVANRQTWVVTGIGDDGSITLNGRGRDRHIPADYAHEFVELAYATTVHGTQGDTVDTAHVTFGEHTKAASAYVAMTRGRNTNTAHLVAEDLDEARSQWCEVFSRDRADLGPAHARQLAVNAIDTYGPAAGARRRPVPGSAEPYPASRPDARSLGR